MRRLILVVPLLLACALPARAQTPPHTNQEVVPPRTIPPETEAVPTSAQTPWLLRWMIGPVHRGMIIRLPIVATDPNRGVTEGVMPIWVIQEKDGTSIEHIHAPSLTYNPNFGFAPTYRYYYYPAPDESLQVRGSINKYEKEGLFQFQDQSVLGTNVDFYSRFNYNVDASQRFFGFGPDSARTSESNYKEDYLMYRVSAGYPVRRGSSWRIHGGSHMQGEKILNGPLKGIAGTDSEFPQVAAPDHRQQIHELRVTLDYDTRDHPVTTTSGMYDSLFAEHAFKGFGSQYEYARYGADARYFKPWHWRVPTVSAVQAQFQQVLGDAPFWAQSELGGKYSLRAYGEGRYWDRGAATINAEQRFTLYKAKMAGVTTEFELAPFLGAGQVFHDAGGLAARYVRPVYGAAVRAVARPQVVGSIDFGAGREGLSAFMDINYSF